MSKYILMPAAKEDLATFEIITLRMLGDRVAPPRNVGFVEAFRFVARTPQLEHLAEFPLLASRNDPLGSPATNLRTMALGCCNCTCPALSGGNQVDLEPERVAHIGRLAVAAEPVAQKCVDLVGIQTVKKANAPRTTAF